MPLYEALQLNQSMYSVNRPALKGKVLEIVSGEGNISTFFVQDNFALRISDPMSQNCDSLLKKFDGHPLIKGVHCIDLARPEFEKAYSPFLEKFDKLIFLNILAQNINDPVKIQNAKKLSWERGRLVLFPPCCIALLEESEEGLKDQRYVNCQNIWNLLEKDCELLLTQFFTVSDILALYNQKVPHFLLQNDVSTLSPAHTYWQ